MDVIESSPMMDGTNTAEPLKFEIKTITGRTYKLITNNFMTNGLRRLMATLAISKVVYPLLFESEWCSRLL